MSDDDIIEWYPRGTPIRATPMEMYFKEEKIIYLSSEEEWEEPNNKKKRKQKKSLPLHRLSPELAAITGKSVLSSMKVIKAVWSYIMKHGLLNPENKGEILCDDLLRKVVSGKTKIYSWALQKHLKAHRLEKIRLEKVPENECQNKPDGSENIELEEREAKRMKISPIHKKDALKEDKDSIVHEKND